jgi:predicted neutral ceramidase superfamily lipid hydrolase
MREFSIYAVIIIILLIMVRYIWLLVKKEIKPALAMWLFFSVAIIMSFITYLSDGDYGFLDNIMNTVDLIYVVTICIAIIIFGDKSSKFSRFDKGCLVAVLTIVVFWIFTQNHKVTNMLMQAILVIAYFPVVKRLLDSKKNTEPFSVWLGMLLAPSLALFSSKGMLATVYSIRAIICVSLLLLLMMRIEILNKKRIQKINKFQT